MEVPLLLNDFLRRAARLYPNKEAIVDGDRRFTYREYQERCNQLAHALLALGIQKGDRVCILSPNSHYFLESYYGVTQIGAILVPLNYRLVAADHEYIINHAGVKAILVDYEYTSVIDQIRPNLRTVQHWIVADPRPGHPTPAGWTGWDELTGAQPTTPTQHIDQDENDVTSINYTSGTTARPKGVMLTHRNVYINAYNFIAHLRIRHEDRELWTLPMFHANGWGGPFALTAMGATHVVLRAVAGAEIYRLIQDEKITFGCMAPAVLSTILNFPEKANYTITTRPRFTIAGAPPPAAFIQRLEQELGWEFIQIYGLTETSPLLTINRTRAEWDDLPAEERAAKLVRAGAPALGCRLSVDQKGEVLARSNVVLEGYWEQPEETERALEGGWFHTGDGGEIGDDGYLTISDRKKDVIITGGENVSSIEVEDVLFSHPDVAEVAVIGVPDEKWGETIKALVVKAEGSAVTEADLIRWCKERLAHYKAPTSVEFREVLDRTATGKLQKFKLRAPYWEGRQRQVN